MGNLRVSPHFRSPLPAGFVCKISLFLVVKVLSGIYPFHTCMRIVNNYAKMTVWGKQANMLEGLTVNDIKMYHVQSSVKRGTTKARRELKRDFGR